MEQPWGKLLAESVDSPDSPDSREYVPSAKKLKNCPPGTFLPEKIQTKDPTSRFLREILTTGIFLHEKIQLKDPTSRFLV